MTPREKAKRIREIHEEAIAKYDALRKQYRAQVQAVIDEINKEKIKKIKQELAS
jgi:hypothetical protein